MNIKQLEYFLTISKKNVISKAAEELYITQQGLSHSIRTLEKELHISLFERSTDGVKLTQAGKLIHPRIRAIVSEYNAILSDLAQIPSNGKHRIKVAFPHGFFLYTPLKLLISFREKYPNIEIVDSYYTHSELEHKFIEEQMDLGISTNWIHSEKFTYDKLFRCSRSIVVNKNHPLANRQYVTIHDFKNERIAISTQGFHDENFLENECKSAGFTPNIFMYCSDFNMITRFAQENIGIALFLTPIGHTEKIPLTRIVPFENLQRYCFDISFITLKNVKKSPAVKLFIQHTIDYCKMWIKSNKLNKEIEVI